MSDPKLGRLTDREKGKPVLHDAPQKQMEAVMSKLDELEEAIKALAAGVGAGAGVVVDEVENLKKIELKI